MPYTCTVKKIPYTCTLKKTLHVHCQKNTLHVHCQKIPYTCTVKKIPYTCTVKKYPTRALSKKPYTCTVKKIPDTCTVKKYPTRALSKKTGQTLVELLPNYSEHKPTSQRYVLTERVEVKIHLYFSQELQMYHITRPSTPKIIGWRYPTRCTSTQIFIYCLITLHVSDVHRVHHQEHIKLQLHPLVQIILSGEQASSNVTKFAIRRILYQWKIHWHQLGSNRRPSEL